MKKNILVFFIGFLLLPACASMRIDQIDKPVTKGNDLIATQVSKVSYKDHAPGQLPFDYPRTIKLNAKAGEAIFAPSKESLKKLYEDLTHPIEFFQGELISITDKESLIKDMNEEQYSVPNALLIEIPENGKIEKGDILFTADHGRRNMFAIVIEEPTQESVKVKFLDPKGEKLEIKDKAFIKITGRFMKGAPIVVKSEDKFLHETVICECNGKVLTRGFNGSLHIRLKENIKPLSIYEKYADGDEVFIPISGKYHAGTVLTANQQLGEFTVLYDDSGSSKSDTFFISEITKKLD